MFCIICQSNGIHVKSMEIHHRNIMTKLGYQIEPYNDTDGICQGICTPCEEKINETCKLKIEKDAEDDLLRVKEENKQLKEVINCLQQKIPTFSLPVPKEEPADDKEFLDIEEFSWIDKNTKCKEDPQPVEIGDSNAAAADQTDEIVTTSMNCSDQTSSEQQELLSSSNRLDEKEINYSEIIEKVKGHFICKLCKRSKKYRSTDNIKSHVRANHLNILHICNNCGKKYKNRSSLTRHLKKEHPRYCDDGDDSRENQAEVISEEIVSQRKTPAKGTRSKQNTNSANKNNQPKNNFNSNCSTTENELDLENEYDDDTASYKVRQKLHRFKYTNLFKKYNDNYICSLCKQKPHKEYGSIKNVSSHIKYYHYKFRYKCLECQVSFAIMHEIKKHFRSKHNGLKCKYKAIWNDLTRINTAPGHLRVYRKQGSHYICGRCNVKFKTLDAIKYHTKEFHYEIINWKAIANNQSSAAAGHGSYAEDDNDDEAITNQNTIEGEIMIDTNSENENQSEEEQMPSSSSQLTFNFENTYKKEYNHYVCLLCSNSDTIPADKIRKCITLVGITRHIKKDHYGFRYICTKCGKKYSKMEHLAYHYKKVHNIVKHVFEATSTERPSKYEEIHKDKIHAKPFYSKEHFIIKDKQYQCKLCPKVFRKLYDIKRHIIEFHFKNRYKCKECPREFSHCWQLINHKEMEHDNNEKSKQNK